MTRTADGGPTADLAGRRRLRLRCRGAVQGVGFRPTVHRLATSLGLGGWVANDPDGATVEVEGTAASVAAFVALLPGRLPPLARLDALEVETLEPLGDKDFAVTPSRLGRRSSALIPPDAALCADCRREMEDPADRRYRYPFTTCTNCGPRFSLVRRLPYDRERTAMACFPLCPDCAARVPATRRSPLPRRAGVLPGLRPAAVARTTPSGEEVATGRGGAGRGAERPSLTGRIVAVKGLGGFQLACRADDGGGGGAAARAQAAPDQAARGDGRDLAGARALVSLGDGGRARCCRPAALAGRAGPPPRPLPPSPPGSRPVSTTSACCCPPPRSTSSCFRGGTAAAAGDDLRQPVRGADLPRQPRGAGAARRHRRPVPAPRPRRASGGSTTRWSAPPRSDRWWCGGPGATFPSRCRCPSRRRSRCWRWADSSR